MDNIKDRILEFLSNPKSNVLLLEGPWGVGKTTLIDGIKKSKEVEKFRVYDMSLFGVESVSELNSKFINDIYVGNKIYKYVKELNPKVSQDIPGVGLGFNFQLSGLFKLFIKNEYKEKHSKPFLIVLDDIERKDRKLSITELFGFIDSLKIENTKIILIANKSSLNSKEDIKDFNGFKEKVVDEEVIIEIPTEKAFANVINNTLPIDFKKCKNLRTILKFNKTYEEYSDKEINVIVWNIVFDAMNNIYNCLIDKDKYIKDKIDYDVRTKNIYSKWSKENADEESIKKEINKKYSKYSNKDIFKEILLDDEKYKIVKQGCLKNIIDLIYDMVYKNDFAGLDKITLEQHRSLKKNFPDYVSKIILKYNKKTEIQRIISEINNSLVDNGEYDYISLYVNYVLIKYLYNDICNDAFNKGYYDELEKKLFNYISIMVIDEGYDYDGELQTINYFFIDDEKQQNIIKDIHRKLITILIQRVISKYKTNLYSGYSCDLKNSYNNMNNFINQIRMQDDIVSPLFDELSKWIVEQVFIIFLKKEDLKEWEFVECRDSLRFIVKDLKLKEEIKNYLMKNLDLKYIPERIIWVINYLDINLNEIKEKVEKI